MNLEDMSDEDLIDGVADRAVGAACNVELLARLEAGRLLADECACSRRTYGNPKMISVNMRDARWRVNQNPHARKMVEGET